jgi:hypothetical protein
LLSHSPHKIPPRTGSRRLRWGGGRADIPANQRKNGLEIDGEEWSKDTEIKKILDCLKNYPNEFWKYPVVIYYLTYKKSNDFIAKFSFFLKKFFVFICIKYINTPTINAYRNNEIFG